MVDALGPDLVRSRNHRNSAQRVVFSWIGALDYTPTGAIPVLSEGLVVVIVAHRPDVGCRGDRYPIQLIILPRIGVLDHTPTRPIPVLDQRLCDCAPHSPSMVRV